MTLRPLAPPALTAGALLSTAGPAHGAGSGPLLAGYGQDFYDHWAGVIQQQNGVVMATLLFGALCLFIITRGKWRK